MKDGWVELTTGVVLNLNLVRRIEPNGTTGSRLYYSADRNDCSDLNNCTPKEIHAIIQGNGFTKPKKPKPQPSAAAFSLEEIEQAKEQINGAG